MFLLEPISKDYIWGGTLLKERFGKAGEGAVVAESWELSTHPDGLTLLKGREESLRCYLENNPGAGGSCVAESGETPILVKLIDAQKALSVQVHPDDAYAAKMGQRGKTELWHILDAQPGAGIYLGVKEPISREEFKRHISENTVEQILRWVPVKAGESYYIPAGTLHAIGAGCLIYEVQQSSNLTYRVYDYGRLGADGKPRQLHIEDALAVSVLSYVDTAPLGKNEAEGIIADCPYFTLRELTVEKDSEFTAPEDSFCHLLCTEGEVSAFQDGNCCVLAPGAGAFLNAGEEILLRGKGKILAVSGKNS
ncbi:MAG: mannose-6-phosphate isomerase [Ruminococcaceae bacterium]|nr:mannose-6-phosphate isomerase [Oscillospiraceae bacterium]